MPEKITMKSGALEVPDHPTIPFIEGDGTGPDIWRASQIVFDACVKKAYGGKRQVTWKEVLAGEKSKAQLDNWLPDETLAAISEHLVAIKGPLTTPVGGGFRSLNVALRQQLDLYACVRPVRYFQGVPSPVKRPEDVNMVIFRENTEDIYAGIEWAEGTAEAKQVIAFLREQMGVKKIRFPDSSGVGIKPMSREWVKLPGGIVVRDVIADAFLQQILLRPREYGVIATPNLNGDYISDALAAQVGGIGIAPGANINYVTGHAIFEATHGTAPKYANQDKVNPGSVILSGEMMFRYMGWNEAADLIISSLEKTIAQKRVTYDFERMMTGATLVSCSGFAKAMVENMT